MIKFPWSSDETSPPVRRRRKWWRFILRHLQGVFLTLLVLAFVAVVILPRMVVTVPSGQVGVLWKRFNGPGFYCWCLTGRGTVLDPRELRQEGLHLIWPWDRLFTYDLRLRSIKETYNAISKDGVNLTATINIRFQLKNNSVAVLHKYIGPDYIASIVRPEIGSWAREVIAQYSAEDVYSNSRQKIENEIRANAQKKLGTHLDRLIQPGASEQKDPNQYLDKLKNSIDLIDTLVLSIKLPAAIVAAINRKTEQFYQVQEYQFRIEKEVKESQRKQIEANGIAAFQKTVSDGISNSYLRWRGIEATLRLAESKNAKVVIIGSGRDGMPIILGNVDAPSPPSMAARPSEGAAKSKDNKSITELSPMSDKPDVKPRASIPFSLSDIQANATRIFEALRPGGADMSLKSETPTK